MKGHRRIANPLLLGILVGLPSFLCQGAARSAPPAVQTPVAADFATDFAAKVAVEVAALGDPSPSRRTLARHRLQAWGIEARESLVEGLSAESLEIRLAAKELLETLDSQQLERQIAKLLRGNSELDITFLPAWDRFHQLCGDSPGTRRLYAGLLREHGYSLRWLADVAEPGLLADPQELTSLDHYLPIEAKLINQGDPHRWALILLAASQRQFIDVPVLTSRVRGGLLNPKVQAGLAASKHYPVLQRLVGQWLSITSANYVNSTMLKIGLAYDCQDVAAELAERSLANPHASPASLATSLILLARLQPVRAETELVRWVDDRRVCHVWQIVAARRRAVQTQVGDVAVALLLHLENRDPREHGFVDLQADPQLIFREFSMGFEDEKSRLAAHASAQTTLGFELPRRPQAKRPLSQQAGFQP